jgi:predicted homoserine dehydrogenase-like protein
VDAATAREARAIPIGLVAGCTLTRDLPAGATVTYDDVTVDETRPLVAMRRLQDSLLASGVL